MNEVELSTVRSTLYGRYATTHAGACNLDAFEPMFAKHVAPYLPAGHGRTVLDLGCGQGALVKVLNDVGFDAIGVDSSPEQVALAEVNAPGRVYETDIFEFLDSNAARFDAVVAMDLLEHLTKSELLLALGKIHSSLQPGGVLVARMPNGGSPFGCIYQSADMTHENVVSPRSFHQACLAVGFENVCSFPCEPGVHGVRSLARAMLLKLVYGLMRIAFVAESGRRRGHVLTANFVGVASAGNPSKSAGIY